MSSAVWIKWQARLNAMQGMVYEPYHQLLIDTLKRHIANPKHDACLVLELDGFAPGVPPYVGDLNDAEQLVAVTTPSDRIVSVAIVFKNCEFDYLYKPFERGPDNIEPATEWGGIDDAGPARLLEFCTATRNTIGAIASLCERRPQFRVVCVAFIDCAYRWDTDDCPLEMPLHDLPKTFPHVGSLLNINLALNSALDIDEQIALSRASPDALEELEFRLRAVSGTLQLPGGYLQYRTGLDLMHHFVERWSTKLRYLQLHGVHLSPETFSEAVGKMLQHTPRLVNLRLHYCRDQFSETPALPLAHSMHHWLPYIPATLTKAIVAEPRPFDSSHGQTNLNERVAAHEEDVEDDEEKKGDKEKEKKGPTDLEKTLLAIADLDQPSFLKFQLHGIVPGSLEDNVFCCAFANAPGVLSFDVARQLMNNPTEWQRWKYHRQTGPLAQAHCQQLFRNKYLYWNDAVESSSASTLACPAFCKDSFRRLFAIDISLNKQMETILRTTNDPTVRRLAHEYYYNQGLPWFASSLYLGSDTVFRVSRATRGGAVALLRKGTGLPLEIVQQVLAELLFSKEARAISCPDGQYHEMTSTYCAQDRVEQFHVAYDVIDYFDYIHRSLLVHDLFVNAPVERKAAISNSPHTHIGMYLHFTRRRRRLALELIDRGAIKDDETGTLANQLRANVDIQSLNGSRGMTMSQIVNDTASPALSNYIDLWLWTGMEDGACPVVPRVSESLTDNMVVTDEEDGDDLAPPPRKRRRIAD